MAEHFCHERLNVYQKGMQCASMRRTLLDDLPRRVAACDRLDRGAESILLNIAHASSSWSPKERIVYLGNACGSALECADACPEDPSPVEEGRGLLRRIAAMLRALSKAVSDDR
jgi:hypothetical protein